MRLSTDFNDSPLERMHKKSEAVRLSDDIIMNLVQSLSAISENSRIQGVPPPKDFESTFLSGSFYSVNSSLGLDEISDISGISEIKEKNTELKNTVKQAVKLFRDTSKEFLSRSIIISDRKTELLHELENVKKVLIDTIEDLRYKSITDIEVEKEGNKDEDFMRQLHNQIELIQKEICLASQQLCETEALINRADKENERLVEKLQKLEDSLGNVDSLDNEDKEGCKCVIN